MRTRRVAVAMLVFTGGLVFSGGLRLRSAQTTTNEPDETIRLDAVVTDRRQQPIRGLRTTDFEVNDSGELRPVDTVTVQKATGHRIVAMFLDEFHVDPGDSTLRARAALREFVDTQLRPDDLVAVMKPLDPLNGIQLSSDRKELHAAIEGFRGRKGDYTRLSPFEEQFISRAPRSADASRAQIVTSALQALTIRIGEAREGRKAVVLVSDGFSPALPRGSDRQMGAVRTIVYAANRFGVSIYPISPQLGQPAGVTDADTEPAAAMLQMLAEQTGGQAGKEGKLGDALRRAVQDLDEYYVITYRARRTGDGKFHPVELRVRRPDAQVRARSGYWDANAALLRPSGTISRTSLLPVRPPHSSPYIRPWIGTSQGPDGLTTISVTWEAGMSPPRNQQVDAITLKVTAEDGHEVFHDRVRARQVIAFNVAPGSIAMEMALEAVGGGGIDIDYRAIKVPDLRVAKPTFATVQLVRTRTARAFAEASVDPKAVPSAAREFSRTERLLLRIPVYGPGGVTPEVSAHLLNRAGATMRALTQLPSSLPGAAVQFDLPLSSLAPDDYRVELIAKTGNQEAREVVLFRVVN
jgi:VWFA-related protein